jgi:SOS-response transcriptional repressor LexA
MKDEELVQRIAKVIDYSGCKSKKEFATKIDFDVSNLSQVLTGGRGVPRSLLDKIFEAYPEIDKAWLFYGKGGDNVIVHVEDMPGMSLQDEKKDYRPRLPITASAGQLADYLGGTLAHECELLPIMRSIPDYDFTMIVKGNSMEPKYEGGDEIACKKVESVIEWGKVYVLATRDGVVIKRLYKEKNGVRCVSYNNTEYPDFIVQKDDILGVYRVVGLIRI